jgi:hypothetical protein
MPKEYKLKNSRGGNEEAELGDLFATKPAETVTEPTMIAVTGPPVEQTHEERIKNVLTHFEANEPPGPESIGNLEYKELCPELLAEYKAVAEKVDALEKIKAMLRASILELTKGAPGTQVHGKYALTLVPRKGQVKIEWESWAREEVGAAAVDALLKCRDSVKRGEMEHSFIKRGEDGVNVDVKEISS